MILIFNFVYIRKKISNQSLHVIIIFNLVLSIYWLNPHSRTSIPHSHICLTFFFKKKKSVMYMSHVSQSLPHVVLLSNSLIKLWTLHLPQSQTLTADGLYQLCKTATPPVAVAGLRQCSVLAFQLKYWMTGVNPSNLYYSTATGLSGFRSVTAGKKKNNFGILLFLDYWSIHVLSSYC